MSNNLVKDTFKIILKISDMHYSTVDVLKYVIDLIRSPSLKHKEANNDLMMFRDLFLRSILTVSLVLRVPLPII